MAVKWTKAELSELEAHTQAQIKGAGATATLEPHDDGAFTIHLSKQLDKGPVGAKRSITPPNCLQAKRDIESTVKFLLAGINKTR